jgi:gliding motility-associated-like protein
LFAANGNWSAYFACGIVTPPVVAADACANAPTICNLDGYFGNTSSSYTADEPGNMCESCGLFEGTLENNSWLQFVANNDTVVFTITLLTCSNNIGIQFGVYSGTNCNNFTLMTPVEWTDVDAPITPGSVSTIVATGLIPGQLYYIMIDGNAGDDCQYIINGLSGIQLGASITPNQTICQGESATIQINVDASIPITWISNPPDPGLAGQENNTTITVSPASSTTYSVHVQNTTGFCSMDTTLVSAVTVLPASDPLCSGGGISCSIDKTDASMCPVAPTFTCDGTATVIVNGADGPFNYLWNDGNTSDTRNDLCAGTYSVTVSDPNGQYSPTSCSVTILGPPSPVITATASPSIIINGDSSVICASGGISYTWSSTPADNSLTGQNNLPCPVVFPSSTTTYIVVGVDAGGCQNTTSVTVTVAAEPPVVDFEAYPLSGCEPLTVHFTDLSSNVEPDATYYWDFGNTTYSYEQNPTAYYANSGTYDVSLTVTNSINSAATLVKQQYITVYPKPIAIFSTSPENSTSIIDPTFSFFDNSLRDPVQWYWTFGDGEYSTSQNTFHCYSYDDIYYHFPSMEDTGTYLVTLIVTTIHGCSDTTSKYIYIESDYALYVPNAFTPNEDPKNQYFCPAGYGILNEDFSMHIYNRWGQRVYETQTWDDCWDGKYNNKPAATGTYVYIINFSDSKRHKHTAKGIVTLYR